MRRSNAAGKFETDGDLPPAAARTVAGAVIEIGERLNLAMPHTKSVYAGTELLERLSAKRAPEPACRASGDAARAVIRWRDSATARRLLRGR